jgi:hypothetical protein
MFELPQGEPIDDDENLDIDKISFPFEYGIISYFKPRAKIHVGIDLSVLVKQLDGLQMVVKEKNLLEVKLPRID